MTSLLKRTLLLGVIALLCVPSWGQGNPYSRKKSNFQAPIFYVSPAKDSTRQDSAKSTAQAEVVPIEIKNKPAVIAAPAPVTQTPQLISQVYRDTLSLALQNQKLDSLTRKLEAVQQQLAELNRRQTAMPALPQKDTLVVMDSAGVKTAPVLTQEMIRAMEAPDYSLNFQQLSQQLGILQGQLQEWEKKVSEKQPPTQVAQPTQPEVSPPTTPEVVADPELQKAVEQQNKQVAELQSKLESYALNNARGIDDLRKAHRDLNQQIEQLFLLQDKKTTVVPIVAPSKTEQAAPQDTLIAKQLADIQRQLAARQDTAAAQPDSALLEQFSLLNNRMATLQSNQQTQLLTITRLQQVNDSLQAQLVQAQNKEPQVQRDTLVQVKTQLDTVRLKTEILGLQKTNIYFQRGSSNLFDADLPVLEKLAQQLLAHPDLKLYLRGYADNLSGSAATNLRLSEARAQQLKTFFIQRGIDENRLMVEAFGSQSPVYKNQLDRRVELEVVRE